MSKQLRQDYKDALASGTARLTECLRIERQDGEVFRFCDHDEPLEVDSRVNTNGNVESLGETVTYVPDVGSADGTAVTHTSDLETNELDLSGPLEENGISRESILAGEWDFATVYRFRMLWDDPVEDEEKITTGWFGQTQTDDHSYSIGFISFKQRFEATQGRTHTPKCDAELGDSRCKVKLDPGEWQPNTEYSERPPRDAGKGSVVKPTSENGAYFECVSAGTSGSSEPNWNTSIGSETSDGSVTWRAITSYKQCGQIQSVTSPTEIETDVSAPDDWFGAGKLRFTSGENLNIEREIDSFSTGTVSLWDAFPFPIDQSDGVELTAGCRKRRKEDCSEIFDNTDNNRSFPDMPGSDVANRFGGQG